MNRIQKIAIEAENLARERGHTPVTTYIGASFKRKRTFASVVCTQCSAHAQLRSLPYNDERDIEGTLTKTNCNVATATTARACANLIPA
jgi:hypothetical protein